MKSKYTQFKQLIISLRGKYLFLNIVLIPLSFAQSPIEINVITSGFTYVIEGQTNPVLTLAKGSTYIFHVNAPGHPFWIKTVQSSGTGSPYSSGVTNNGIAVGDLTFAVPQDVPDGLFYNCENHSSMTNSIGFETSANQIPSAFNWVNAALDSIQIDNNNLTDTYTIKWNSSLDGDGDAIKYHVKEVAPEKDLIEIVDDTSIVIEFEEFIKHWPAENISEDRLVFKFEVWANDGIDSTRISGNPLELIVNKSQFLATISEGIPLQFALHQNYPNPFNPATTINYNLAQSAHVTIIIYNVLGQVIKTFENRKAAAGHNSITWNGKNNLGNAVGAGVYFYQLKTLNFIQTRKMLFVK